MVAVGYILPIIDTIIVNYSHSPTEHGRNQTHMLTQSRVPSPTVEKPPNVAAG